MRGHFWESERKGKEGVGLVENKWERKIVNTALYHNVVGRMFDNRSNGAGAGGRGVMCCK